MNCLFTLSSGTYNNINLGADKLRSHSTILNDSADLNARNEYGMTALDMAMRSNKSDTIAILCERGADPNTINKYGSTALHTAIHSNKPDMVTILCKHGANPNIMDKEGCNALHCVVDANLLCDDKCVIIRILCENKVDLDAVNADGFTALHMAINNWDSSIAEELCKRGANLNIMNARRFTPLYYAICKRNTSIVKLLIAHGADINIKYDGDAAAATALHLAITTKAGFEIIKVLIFAGAQTDMVDQSNKTALDLAMEFGDEKIITLIQFGSKWESEWDQKVLNAYARSCACAYARRGPIR